jgi:predicted lipid-binding transport protein (Tim44 family)
MALSEREQKLLEEMERNLLAQDSDLAKTLQSAGSSNRSAGKLVIGVLTFIFGLGLLILSVVLQVAFFGIIAFLVMLIGLVVASSNFRIPELPKPSAQSRASFFEDRWNQRFGNE